MTRGVSKERTLVLPEYCGQTPGLSWPLVWPAKDPGDSDMDFSLDVSGWLADIGDTLGSFTVGWIPEGDAGDLVITSAVANGGILTIYTDAGTAYVNNTVTFDATGLLTGQVLSRSVTLPVEPRYGNFIAPQSISGVVQ